MKITVSNILAVGGVCALVVGMSSAASADRYDHRDGNNDHGQYHQRYQREGHAWNNQGWRHDQNRFHPNYDIQNHDHSYGGGRDNRDHHFISRDDRHHRGE